MLMIFVTVLWSVIRWISLSFYHVMSRLLRRRHVRLPAAHTRRHMVYAGKWQLSDDAKSCGRPAVVTVGNSLTHVMSQQMVTPMYHLGFWQFKRQRQEAEDEIVMRKAG